MLPGGALLPPPFEHAREADDDLDLERALRQVGRANARDQEPTVRALVPRPVRTVEIRTAQTERRWRADVERCLWAHSPGRLNRRFSYPPLGLPMTCRIPTSSCSRLVKARRRETKFLAHGSYRTTP